MYINMYIYIYIYTHIHIHVYEFTSRYLPGWPGNSMCVDTCTSLGEGAALQCLYRGAEERAGAHRCGRCYTTASLLLHALDPSPPCPSRTAALPCKRYRQTHRVARVALCMILTIAQHCAGAAACIHTHSCGHTLREAHGTESWVENRWWNREHIHAMRSSSCYGCDYRCCCAASEVVEKGVVA